MGAIMPVIGLIGSLASGVLGAVGAQQQARAQADAAEYQAQVARNNAIIEQQKAAAERQKGAVDAQQQDFQSRQLMGKQLAGMAASGVDVESGTATNIRQSQAELSRLDTLTTAANAERRAWGYDVAATNQQAQAGLYQMQARDARRAGSLAAFSSILGGITSFGSRWASMSAGGGFG